MGKRGLTDEEIAQMLLDSPWERALRQSQLTRPTGVYPSSGSLSEASERGSELPELPLARRPH
jgi:hypothetical protein